AGIVAVIGAYQLARLSRPDAALPGTALATAALPPMAEPETTCEPGAASTVRRLPKIVRLRSSGLCMDGSLHRPGTGFGAGRDGARGRARERRTIGQQG
ncbi:hypothetical protein OMR07_07160, partial [Methylobacterium organophilum]|nr:hypothetical protein [Methylobacterium organophilum]